MENYKRRKSFLKENHFYQKIIRLNLEGKFEFVKQKQLY